MKEEFKRKWYRITSEKKTNVIAGIDPQDLPAGTDVLEWCKKFIDDMSPHVAGFKLNPSFFVGAGKGKIEDEVNEYLIKVCNEKGLISIYDRKVSEIGNTGKRIIDGAIEMGYDSVTIAPFAGNGAELINHGVEKEIGVINMGLMSNVEYLRETGRHLSEEGYRLWETRLQESLQTGVSGLVLGGTYKEGEDGFDDFVKFLALTRESRIPFLIPGLGKAQGGDPEKFLELITRKGIGIKGDRCMLSFSREFSNPETRIQKIKNINAIVETCLFSETKEGFEYSRAFLK